MCHSITESKNPFIKNAIPPNYELFLGALIYPTNLSLSAALGCPLATCKPLGAWPQKQAQIQGKSHK
jgi:hypothetical protein